MLNDNGKLKVFWSKGFTLIELLVVISVIAMLMSILMPAFGKVRHTANAVVCKSNLRTLVMANIGYASENDGYMVLAASDIAKDIDGDGVPDNLKRWHGERSTMDDPFEASFSPLVSYLGSDGEVKKCPERVNFRHGDPWEWDFEDGCGGYGYNMTYLGSRLWRGGYDDCDKATRLSEIDSPAQTLMFADTAMAKKENGSSYYLEYSFAEAPYFVHKGQVQLSWGYASPSLHFRHSDQVNVAWSDGHIGSERILDFDEMNVYAVHSASMMLGWFKVLDNEYFELK